MIWKPDEYKKKRKFKLDDYLRQLVFTGIAGAIAFSTWIVRTIFTNQKAINMLQQKTDMQHRDLKTAIERLDKGNDLALLTQNKIVEMLAEIRDKNKET